MKKNIIAIMSLTIAMGLASCSNEDYLGGHVDRSGAGVAIETLTAQMGGSAAGRTWTEGDNIGVSVSYYDLTAQNRSYLCGADGTTFTPATGDPIYVKGVTSIVAYWPFTGVDNAEPIIELKTEDQSQIIDFLVAKTDNVSPANGKAVNLTFERIMAKLKVNITATDDVITKWTMTGINTEAVFNTYTAELSMSGAKTLGDTGDNITSINLTLLPQSVSSEDGEVTLTLFGGKRTYTFTLNASEAFTLKSAETTTYDVNISDGMTTVEIVPGGTVDWNEK